MEGAVEGERGGRPTMRIALSLALLLVAAGLEGDQAEPETRLVDLNVIALDAHGQPVGDLTADDFQVSDSGKPQKIEFFRHYDSKLSAAPALGLDEHSNRAGANISRATVVLLDFLNESFGTLGAAQNQLVRYLSSVEDAGDLYLYFLTLDGRLFPVRGIPLTEPPSEPADTWTRQIKPLMENAQRTVLGVRQTQNDLAVREKLTFAALEDLAGELSRVPGHKNIVWVTDGIPVILGPSRSDIGQSIDYTPMIQRLAAALDRSGIAIYPVRQVMLGSSGDLGGQAGGRGGRGGFSGTSTGLGDLDTLDQFAGLTGGRPDSGKDVGAAIKQAMQDVRTSYQIGYYPAGQNWDGKFHKIRVASKRKGVRLQTKTGYYAWPEPPEALAQEAIRQAATAAFDATEIGLRAKVSADPQDRSVVSFDSHIDANDVVLVQDGATYRGQLKVALADYPAEGPPQISPIVSINLSYSPADHDQVLKEGIPFAQKLQLPGNIKTVRLIVFDQGSNAIGSISLPSKSSDHSQ
jgi:VWFA-related protein